MKKGLLRTLFSIEPGHMKALRDEANRRMLERGTGRSDASEVLREALDLWMKRRGK